MWQPLQDFALEFQVKACDVASLTDVQEMAMSLDSSFTVRPLAFKTEILKAAEHVSPCYECCHSLQEPCSLARQGVDPLGRRAKRRDAAKAHAEASGKGLRGQGAAKNDQFIHNLSLISVKKRSGAIEIRGLWSPSPAAMPLNGSGAGRRSALQLHFGLGRLGQRGRTAFSLLIPKSL